MLLRFHYQTHGLRNMGMLMANNTSDTIKLIERVRAGDSVAIQEIFSRHRDRLQRMVDLRLDSRLQGRINPSEVLHEAYQDVVKGMADYLHSPKQSIFLWLRTVVGERLFALHRQHLGAGRSDASLELTLYRDALPEASSAALAAQLLGRQSSLTQAAVRAERILRIQETLNAMEPIDRELLSLRHFEQLTRSEAAQVLEIEESAAAKRYIRALKKMQRMLSEMP